MRDGVERRPRQANPHSAVSTHAVTLGGFLVATGAKALFFSSFAPYIGGAGLPGYGNKSPPQ
jgi:hypothetical protein